MKKFAASLALLGLVSSPAYAQDNGPAYRPASAWAADFGDDYCRLTRDFSNGTDTVAVVLERIQPANTLRLMLVGDSLKTFRGTDSLSYSFLPAGGERQGPVARSSTAAGQQVLMLSGVAIGAPLAFGPPADGAEFKLPLYDAPAELEFAGGIEGIAITKGLVAPATIETGPLKNVVAVLQDCTYDLVAFWGLDADKHRQMSAAALPLSGTTLPQGTIPFTEFAKLAGSANQVRVMVSAAGEPQTCQIHFATLDERTNEKICKHLMENAKFSPAKDSAGEAMASYWVTEPMFLNAPFGGR